MEQISFKDEDFCRLVKSVALAIEHGSAAFEFFCYHSVFFRDFNTELQLASFIGHLPFVQALVAAKADVNAKDK